MLMFLHRLYKDITECMNILKESKSKILIYFLSYIYLIRNIFFSKKKLRK